MIDSETFKTKNEFLICLFLVAVTFTVYFQVGTHEFVVYDDRIYVSENQYVQEGFSTESLQWAFSLKNKDKTYWHPLTWLSHMLDVQIFGLKSGGHLMTNVILHVLNVLLLFSLLKRSTGCLWRSAFVATLFALHPMNVESVAWVAARKNVLSTTFLLLTLVAYIRYAESPGIYRYLIIAGCYTIGLMAKPMLVTLPFGLLLLDFWPLKRLSFEDGARSTGGFKLLGKLIAEKIPLFILSAATIYIATISLHRYGDMVQTAAVDMKLRIANALVSYVVYLEKLIYPVDLTCFYPFPETVPFWKTTLSFMFLIAVSVRRHESPQQTTIRHFRLVLVPRHAGARHRTCSGRSVAGHRGQIRVRSLHRNFHYPVMGICRSVQTLSFTFNRIGSLRKPHHFDRWL